MNVVVGVDSSPHAAKVLEKAVLEARMRSSDLHVVHVFNPPTVYLEDPIDVIRVAEAERAAVWAGLERILSGAGTNLTRVDLDGYPPDTLVSYATRDPGPRRARLVDPGEHQLEGHPSGEV